MVLEVFAQHGAHGRIVVDDEQARARFHTAILPRTASQR
jgi:hypothetical protein